MGRKANTITLSATFSLLAMVNLATPAQAAAPNCTSNVCYYQKAEYKGNQITSAAKKGICYKDKEIESLIVTLKKGEEIRVYSGTNCKGAHNFDMGKGTFADIPASVGWIGQSYKRI
ncbi:peptidase inhibitor family I36 protein [Streptomyces europaeiscabiei]|uniref:peptidase inhibitor family I36 protein n=1 Tax=Streptomyces europaeiscabiei TaxID=146819 RepID=UPI0029AECC3F|nr:peptidase inhibitor family I36 protein [Streptomyces europaeiscabiei]MDX3632768.1 peptidase inhibitor family I36 protein [Streptomyces europaeiscabiei]MDX3654407.1 peptidase inhibitor family I36 protein [Streptomyces europaeiscabiei]